MLFGPTGTGKTTLAGQVIRSKLVDGEPVLGLNCPHDPDARFLYFSMDRPRQAARSLRRQFTNDELHAVRGRLAFWKGPLGYPLINAPRLLVNIAQRHNATHLVFDSVKDFGGRLSDDETGSAINQAIQLAIAAGLEVLELHHPRKTPTDGNPKAAKAIDDVFGSAWLTAGCGSVLALNGKPGDDLLTVDHLKQPADAIGPLRIRHNKPAGRFVIDGDDLAAWLRHQGEHGAAARDAAAWVHGTTTPDRNQIEKARRQLDALTKNGNATRTEGTKGGDGGGLPTRWYATRSDHAPDHAPHSA